MLLPQTYIEARTDWNKPQVESSYFNTEDRGYTNFQQVDTQSVIDKTQQESEATESTFSDKIISVNSEIHHTTKYARITQNYSSEYVSLNTRGLVESIQKELSQWIEIGTSDAIINIFNIKKIFEEYEPYLVSEPNSRLLLSSLELIFENNQWESVPSSKLQFLSRGLDRFSSGEVKNQDLITFVKEVHNSKLATLSESKNGETQSKEETE